VDYNNLIKERKVRAAIDAADLDKAGLFLMRYAENDFRSMSGAERDNYEDEKRMHIRRIIKIAGNWL